MEVAIKVGNKEEDEVITLYRVDSITDDGNEIEVVIHEDTDVPDELDLCTTRDVDLQTHKNARIEEPGTIWFENAEIVHASEDY